MNPSDPAVTITWPHKWELDIPLQALLKNLYSDLHIVGETTVWPESRSVSSGHVAETFGTNSERNPRLMKKQSGEDKDDLWINSSPSEGDNGVDSMPHQGMAIVALWDRKLSEDIIFFALEVFLSWPVWFQIQTFEPSLSETICFPSEVKEACIWPALLRPEGKKRRGIMTYCQNEHNCTTNENNGRNQSSKHKKKRKSHACPISCPHWRNLKYTLEHTRYAGHSAKIAVASLIEANFGCIHNHNSL